jgi:poly-beta-1,6-N-acetyl-D-glucosamine synthase
MDLVAYALSDFWVFVQRQWATHDLWTWSLFFIPCVLLVDIPRQVLPPVAVACVELMGWRRRSALAGERFVARQPSVSVLLVGHNEEGSIGRAIASLLALDYPRLEIVVVDDHSSDGTYQAALPYARQGLIRLWRNDAASGRAGRPSASNLGLRQCTGDYILSVDSDCSFDRDALRHLLEPFHDPRVGAVGGNLRVRNLGRSPTTLLQAVEYVISIGLYRRWLDLLGVNVQISGAFGCFRRCALEQVGGWDSELAEDADLSLKIRRSGWKIAFAAKAVAMTDVPETIATLAKQRMRWDRGFVRTFVRKHGDLLDPRRSSWLYTAEMGQELLFSLLCPYAYVVYVAILLVTDPALLLLTWLVCAALFASLTLLALTANLMVSERKTEDAWLMPVAVAFPFYKSFLRLIRLLSFSMEIVRARYEDPFLPGTAWRNAPRW